jgi:hypothetical protein
LANPQPHSPAVVILGADAFLAAHPATPVQLANACLAAGYSAAVPASWGDELIAEAALKRIAARGDEALILCSCPRVAERMRRMGSLRANLLPFVSPPVAAARYLRARAGMQGLHITYVGDCPGAADPAIDRYASPSALLKSLAKRNIVPTSQSTTMDERVARDGRRFYSLPGGAPAPNWIYAEQRGQGVVEPESADYIAEVANRVAQHERCVLDLATRLGCACSGAIAGAEWTQARESVAAVEPERSVHEVLDHELQVDVAAMLEPWIGTAGEGDATPATSLSTLAAAYDPGAKAAPVREPPSSPVPFPQPKPLPRKSGPSVQFISPTSEPTTNAKSKWDGVDRRKWDGVERRTGWKNGKPPGFGEPRTAGPPGEPRTSPLRPQHTFIRVPSSAVDRRKILISAAALSIIVSVAATSGMWWMFTHQRLPISRPAAVAATSPPADTVVIPASDTSTAPLAPDPSAAALPRTPIGIDPAQRPRTPRRKRTPSPAEAFEPTPPPRDSAAAVYKSGAAPIPRISGPSGASMAATPDLSIRDSAEQLRADIAARRHRVDSLAHVVDSLGRPR